MQSARLLFALGLGIAAGTPALAQDATAWIGAPDCRLAAVKPAPSEPPTWSGACKDGYADGKGVLEWRNAEGKVFRLSAVFAAGRVQGEGELRYASGDVYTGTLRDGVPDGHGYFKYANGDQYEGAVHRAQREGMGEFLDRFGNDYKGQWKDGEEDGTGVMVYKLGGRYEGGWKDGERRGPGKLVFAGTPGREAATVDGRPSDQPATPESHEQYVVKMDRARTGSMIPLDAARGVPVRPSLSYEQLSATERGVVDSWFPALAPGDEPPYPVHGPALFYKAVSKVVGKTEAEGKIRVYVLVGKDGKAVNVIAAGFDDPEARKTVAMVAGAIPYKPAVCAGQPCEMTYAFNLSLSLEF